MRGFADILREVYFLDSEKASELYVDEVVDGAGRLLYLDVSGSVSALTGQDIMKRVASPIQPTLGGPKDPSAPQSP